jgi:hypothetical protein
MNIDALRDELFQAHPQQSPKRALREPEESLNAALIGVFRKA